MSELKDAHVLLTGGSRGLGPYIAHALARHGAHLALAARSEEQLETVAEDIRQWGVRVITVPTDIRNTVQRRALVERVRDAFGRINVLVNNAGVEIEGAFTDLAPGDIQTMLDVNIGAPMALTHLVLPHMMDRGTGHIVNVASLAASGAAPYDAVYAGTKAGLAKWTQALRLELVDTGVQCSTIFPGYVTGAGMFARFGLTPPRTVGSCSPEDVATAVARAIHQNRSEIIVNSRPLRPLLALNELFPALGDWLVHRLGVTAFQRRKAQQHQHPADTTSGS